MYFDMQGRPMDMMEWGRAMERVEERTVGRDEIGDVCVSTVWIGLNHNFGEGAPLIFETMVFGGPLDGEQERYSTIEEARAGHAAMVERALPSRAAGR